MNDTWHRNPFSVCLPKVPYLKLLLIKRNVDIEPASLLGSAHHRSFWVILAQMHYPLCQKWWVLSFSPVFSDQLFLPSHLTLLLKIAKQMGKVEQNIKREHLFLNSYLNEKFNPLWWLCWDPPQITRVQELPHLLQLMQRGDCSYKGIGSAWGQGLRVPQHLFTLFCIPFAKYVILQSGLNLIQNISFSCDILGHHRQAILKLVYFELSTS